MITITENNTNVEFINSEIVHVTLKEGGVLSRHLLRELQVVSKVNYGRAARGFIVSNQNVLEAGISACSICKKADSFKGEMKMAVVCRVACLRNATCPFATEQKSMSKIFSEYSSALSWISEN